MSWTLYAGGAWLGTLTYVGGDWPRTYYQFEPTPEFRRFRGVLDLEGSH